MTRVWSTGPIIPPDRHVVTVTRCEALHIAATFMAELDEVRRQAMQYELPEEIGDITEIITSPLNMGFSSMEEPTERGYLAHKLYYAWNVPVIIILDGKRIDCFVSVDTETGEIINCGKEKQERRVRIPTIPPCCSEGRRPVVPKDSGRVFRVIAATCSE